MLISSGITVRGGSWGGILSFKGLVPGFAQAQGKVWSLRVGRVVLCGGSEQARRGRFSVWK